MAGCGVVMRMAAETVSPRTYVRFVQRMAGTSRVEGLVLDWVVSQPEPGPRLPVSWLDDHEVAAELGQIQRNRARDAAREAELILRLAELRPDVDDPGAGSAGAQPNVAEDRSGVSRGE